MNNNNNNNKSKKEDNLDKYIGNRKSTLLGRKSALSDFDSESCLLDRDLSLLETIEDYEKYIFKGETCSQKVEELCKVYRDSILYSNSILNENLKSIYKIENKEHLYKKEVGELFKTSIPPMFKVINKLKKQFEVIFGLKDTSIDIIKTVISEVNNKNNSKLKLEEKINSLSINNNNNNKTAINNNNNNLFNSKEIEQLKKELYNDLLINTKLNNEYNELILSNQIDDYYYNSYLKDIEEKNQKEINNCLEVLKKASELCNENKVNSLINEVDNL